MAGDLNDANIDKFERYAEKFVARLVGRGEMSGITTTQNFSVAPQIVVSPQTGPHAGQWFEAQMSAAGDAWASPWPPRTSRSGLSRRAQEERTTASRWGR